MLRIGVIGVQGAVSEHIDITNQTLKELGFEGEAFWLRTLEEAKGVNAVIIPGGESTTITRLMKKSKLWDFVKERGKQGMPILGTCAGLVVLAKEGDEDVRKTGQELMGLMNTKIRRNAFGRQRESFEADLEIPLIGKKKFRGVFIRAPIIEKAEKEVEVLAKFEGKIVFAKQANTLACAFHPELTEDTRIHKYFLRLI
jgi:5'-phosphate synthase pdxT subunit